jgi:hypothetical protein
MGATSRLKMEFKGDQYLVFLRVLKCRQELKFDPSYGVWKIVEKSGSFLNGGFNPTNLQEERASAGPFPLIPPLS